MQIRWGMQNLLEVGNLESNIEVCRNLGLDFIELNMNLPECQPNRLDVDKLLELKKRYNIFYTFHLAETFDITSFDDDIRAAYFTGLSKTIHNAKKLETPIINMHMNVGVHFSLPNQKIYLYEKYKSEYMAKIVEFANYIENELHDSGIRLSIENTGIYDRDYIIKAVDELLKKDSIALTWDIGHDFSSGNNDIGYIKRHMDKLKHMHIHDAIGKNNHLPVYSGEIDIDNRLSLARDNGYSCVIEVKTLDGLKESIRRIKDKKFY